MSNSIIFIPRVFVVILLSLAAVFTYIVIWLILKTPLFIDLFRDRPGLRKVHQRIIPRVGGIAILTGFVIFVQVWRYFFPFLPQLPSNLFVALTFASFAIMLVGLVDDMVVFEIHNRAKFILELMIAAEIVFFNDICLDKIHLLNWDFSLGWLGVPITIIWIVGVTNAINIIDGVDGLAGSIMAVVFATIGVLTGFSGDIALLFLSVILVGLVCGFLGHNISPARVFLGDTGSLLLGMIIGVLSIYLVSNKGGSYPLLIAPLVVGLPVLDILVAMTRRFLKKIFGGVHFIGALSAMSVADNEHMHHRLIFRGLTHSETVLILVLFHAVICMSAIMVKFTNTIQSIALLVCITILGIWFLYKLHFFDRFNNFIGGHKIIITPKMLEISVINASKVLRYSLKKYDQTEFRFSFKTIDDVLTDPERCDAFIVEQGDDPFDKVIALASAAFMESECPVIIVTSNAEDEIEKYLQDVREKGFFQIFKKPIYIPVLMCELDRLIKRSRGRTMDKIAEDTRQFFMQAMTHEEIQ